MRHALCVLMRLMAALLLAGDALHAFELMLALNKLNFRWARVRRHFNGVLIGCCMLLATQSSCTTTAQQHCLLHV